MKLVSDHHTVGLKGGGKSVPGVPVEIEDAKLAADLLTRGFRVYEEPAVEKPKAKPAPKPKAKAKPKPKE